MDDHDPQENFFQGIANTVPEEEKNVEALVDRATELAQAVQDFQVELGIDKQMGKLREKVNDNARELRNGKRWRRFGFALIAVSLFFGSISAYLVIRLQTLVRTECIRSAQGAVLRGQLINGQTSHFVIPKNASKPLVVTLTKKNAEYDKLQQLLETTGKKIPKVTC